MTLKDRLLDAIIDGNIGSGIIVTRSEFMDFFRTENTSTTGVFLSNSEINTGANHSPTYDHFTTRISTGVYRIHPQSIIDRMNDRGI
jgi:hypothetical protein